MKPETSAARYKLIFLSIGALLVTYVISRAHLLSFTHDESLSYLIVNGNLTWSNTANNHLLNTALMSFFQHLFGSSEFVLRLPNVLAFFMYLTGCYLIFKKNKFIWVSLFGFILALSSPFLLEFFSLARGYGLSLGSFILSLYFLIRKSDHTGNANGLLQDFFFALTFALLGVYANLALINYYICVPVIFFYKYIRAYKLHRKNRLFNLIFWIITALSTIPLFLGISRLLFLKNGNQLYFGASNMFNSLQSIIDSSIHFEFLNSTVSTYGVIAMIVLFIVGFIHIIISRTYNSTLFYIFLLASLLSIGLFIEHFLFDAKYPKSRTALFYIPIFSVYLFALVSELITYYHIRKRWYISCISICIIFLIVNFTLKANFSYASSWKYDANTKAAMKLVKKHIEQRDKKYTISNHWLFTPTINYYIDQWKLNLLHSQRDGINLSSDFIYRLEDKSSLFGFKVIESYKTSNSQLLLKKE